MSCRLYPILSLSAARSYEESVLQGDPARVAAAVEQAGTAVAAALLADFTELRPWPDAPRLLVLTGKGLNGADALVAARLLQRALAGLRATVVLAAPESELHPVGAAALRDLRAAMGPAVAVLEAAAFTASAPGAYEVVLDGIHGHGFRPPLRDPVASLAAFVNALPEVGLRAAVDLPSGVGAQTDAGAFVADFTYVTGVAKEPCFDPANAGKVGRIRFLEIAPFLDQPVPDNQRDCLASPQAHRALNRLRPATSDKRSYGHVLVLGGSVRMPGAVLMATLAALKAGAGLVTTLAPAPIVSRLAGHAPEAMWRPCETTAEGGLETDAVRAVAQLVPHADALLIGPGLHMDRQTVFNLCRIIRESSIPLVIDASALTQDVMAAVLGRKLVAGPVVLTPHAGEFARLLASKENSADPEVLLNFTRTHRCLTVLKGSPTRICDGRRIIVAPVGGPVLARGGSGDVLAGMVATLLAQNPQHPLDAAIAAVTWHGAAGDALARANGHRAVTTTDMLEHLAPALRA